VGSFDKHQHVEAVHAFTKRAIRGQRPVEDRSEIAGDFDQLSVMSSHVSENRKGHPDWHLENLTWSRKSILLGSRYPAPFNCSLPLMLGEARPMDLLAVDQIASIVSEGLMKAALHMQFAGKRAAVLDPQRSFVDSGVLSFDVGLRGRCR
jgi:hypothetical protein